MPAMKDKIVKWLIRVISIDVLIYLFWQFAVGQALPFWAVIMVGVCVGTLMYDSVDK